MLPREGGKSIEGVPVRQEEVLVLTEVEEGAGVVLEDRCVLASGVEILSI